MATLLTPSPSGALAARAVPVRALDRWFYPGMAVAIVLAEAVGFGHSERGRIAGHPALHPMAILHITLFAGWLPLFLVQTFLVATGRPRFHRRLGAVAATVAGLMLVTAPPLAIDLARRGVASSDPLAFLFIMLVDLLMFAIFAGSGIYFRRRAETHKRLMLLATMSLLPPGISRWPIAIASPGPVIMGVMVVFLVAAPVRDLWARRRMHAVSLWGGVALLLSVPVRMAIAYSAPWHRVAAWLIR
jgi:uncharacterized membrane protein YozB (DUF420 family)